MSKLPSIINTYQNALQLYVKFCIPTLPFALLLGFAQYFYAGKVTQIRDLTTANVAIPNHEWFISGAIGIGYFILYTLLFCIVTYGIYQGSKRQPLDYSIGTLNYKEALENGASRTFPVLLASLILIAPFMVTIIGILLFEPQNKSLMALTGLLMLVVSIALFVIFIYFYVASALIIIKGYGPLEGLKQSFRITKGHWWKTFFLIVILAVIAGLLSFVLKKLIGNYASEIMTIIMFSFGSTLMLTHMGNLEQAYQLNNLPKA